MAAPMIDWGIAIIATAACYFVLSRLAAIVSKRIGKKAQWDIPRAESRLRILASLISLYIFIMLLPIDEVTTRRLLSLFLLATVALVVLVLIEPLKRTFLTTQYHSSARPVPVETRTNDVSEFDGKVFISYRREDSQTVVDRLCDKLFERLGRDRIFRDIDSLALGRDFREVVDETIHRCSVGIVVVGPNWLGAGEDGNRRIDLEEDLVRLEVQRMLSRDIPVIPVLLGDISLPSESDLPNDVKSIVYRNAARMRPDPDFETDVERLIQGIINNSD